MHNSIGKEFANYTTECYIGAAGLNRLEHEWHDLEARLQPRRFFHCYPWWKCYLTHLEETAESFHFFMVRQGARVVAIFPLKRIRQKYSFFSLDVWELPFHRHMNLSDAIMDPKIDANAILNNLTAYLKTNPAWHWDILRCNKTLAESPFISAIQHHKRHLVEQDTTSNYIDTSKGADPVFQRMSGSFKRNLRRLWKRLEDAGEITVRYVQAPEELPAALEQFIEIEAGGWKGEQGTQGAIKLSGGLVSFYKELSKRFGASKENQINLLELNGVPIAAQYGIRLKDTLYLLKIGYNESYSKMSPGYMLLYRLLSDADRQGIKEINFVTGTVWNSDWNAEMRPVVWAELYNTSLKGRLAWVYRHLKEFIIKNHGYIKARLANAGPEKR